MHLSVGVRELRGPNVTRQRPPNRRGHELLGFEHDGIRYTAGIGHFVDGGVAKIFRNIAKHGTALDVNVRDAGRREVITLLGGCVARSSPSSPKENRNTLVAFHRALGPSA